jgi:hypothetical protein
VQEVHLICRLRQRRVAQSIGLLVEGIPNLVSELNGAEYLTQRTSTDSIHGYPRVQIPAYSSDSSEGVNGFE